MLRPLMVDLYCGTCGWGEAFLRHGFRVVGIDIYRHDLVPPGVELQIRDAREVDGREFAGAAVIIAGPPCPEYARWSMPWTRAKNPPVPSGELWRTAERIGREADAPLIIENVRGAQQFHGAANWHCGPFYLWGEVPALMPSAVAMRAKESYGSKQKDLRARIPADLSDWVARCFANEQFDSLCKWRFANAENGSGAGSRSG